MNRGFHLSLLSGTFSPGPVPQAVIDALTEVQVTSTVGAQGGFQLKLSLGKNSAVAQMHNAGFFNPRSRFVIAVTVNGSTEVLMDGIVTRQELTASSAAGKSVLTVTGLDLTALMDFIDLTGIPYPALPMFVIVELILAKYAVLGVAPIAIPPPLALIQNPIERFLKQTGTDYAYVSKLAGSAGAVFYLDPGPSPGNSIAYWGPDLSKMFGGPQPALSINLDASTNIDSLSFSYDGTLATQYLVTIIEPNTKIPLPIPMPNIDLLKAPLAGKQMGTFMVPQIGAGVWLQFEGGDPDYPVWTGGWWGNPAEVPALALAGVPGDANIVLQSTLQNAVVISDLPGPTGGIMLKSTTGATIIVNDTGIYIQNGKGASIVMAGPSVTINNGALVVV